MNRCSAVALALLFAALFSPSVAHATDPAIPTTLSLAEYFPPGVDFDHDPEAPTLEGVVGWEPGLWHLHHHELIDYLKVLTEWSERLTMVEYARSHGRRPLVVLAVTSPENHERLEEIRLAHLKRIRKAAVTPSSEENKPDKPARDLEEGADRPAIVLMGYGVHGNEASASNVAPLLAYHLAASRAPAVVEFLRSNIVLVDPCLNPDGMERFAAWSNSHRGRFPSSHRRDREHVEAWPGGRSNYYWFDLNRDWLPAVHPESQGRLRLFHEWMPHVVTDYHEMGNVNRTYFFQPGIPDMVHPLTPEKNQELTAGIAEFHAKALDEIGELYYTRESYDDYYIGKGSTYPDLCGSIGILYEQASSRGFHQDTEHGRLTFPTTIRNQLATSLSTLEAVGELRESLTEAQLEFHRPAETGENSATVAHLVSAPGDPQRIQAFRELLDQHRIRYSALEKTVSADGERFHPSVSLVIHSSQPRHRLLTAMMETRTSFANPVFYDVSAWHLPSAYGLLHAELEKVPPVKEEIPALPQGRVAGAGVDSAIAYLIPWEPHAAPAALWRFSREKLRCWVAQKPIHTGKEDGATTYAHGTIVVPVGVQEEIDAGGLRQLMEEVASDHGLRIRAMSTGLGDGGIDLGSPSLAPLRQPEVLLVTGSGVGSTAAGDIWHQFDQVWEAPVTMVERTSLSSSVLRDFNTLILAESSYSSLSSAAKSAIEDWVAGGGCLVAIGSTTSTLALEKWVGAKTVKADFDKFEEKPEKNGPPAGQKETSPEKGGEPEKRKAAAKEKDPRKEKAKTEKKRDADEEIKADGKGKANEEGGANEEGRADEESKAADNGESGEGSDPKPEASPPRPGDKPYDTASDRRGARQVKGVVVRAWFDASHPIAYGYSQHGPYLALLRNNAVYLEASANSLHNPLVYTDDPLVSGYIARANLEAMKGTTPVQIRSHRSGRVVLFTDNPVFRGHWLGSSKLLANAIFFGPLVSTASAEESAEGEDELEDDL